MPPRRPFIATVDLLDDAGEVRPLADIERDVIAVAVARYGSIAKVARVLKVGRSTLYRKGHRTDPRLLGGIGGKRPPGWTRPGDSG